MASRRRSRELALQALYQYEMGGTTPDVGVPMLAEHFEADMADLPFARELAEGTVANLEEIDRLIEASSENWSLSRMSRVDLAILRLAAYELRRRPDIPASVTINEAIELGKRYGAEETAPFLNGVLDRIARQLGRDTRSPGRGAS